jgi:hypothetical protein
MAEDRNPQNQEEQNGENNLDNLSGERRNRFESDTQRIIHRHLENKNDLITDEDIASVRVGMTPPDLDEATEARFEGDEATDRVEEEMVGDEEDLPEDENTEGRKATPWDISEED